MTILRYVGIVLLVLIAGIMALIGILTVTRSSPIRQVIAEGDSEGPPYVTDPLFARSIELYAGTHIDDANEVEILSDGDGTYPPMWSDIASAQQTITVQMYYSQPGAVADTLAKYLIERRRAGVRVLLLLDAFGSDPLKGDWADRVREGGVELAWLRPIKWYTLHKAAHRSHVRLVVVDGRVGYTGGWGIADYWLGDGRTDGQWREANVRFRGPTVSAVQATFAAGWVEATGELLTGERFFPRESVEPAGSVKAGFMHTLPVIGSTPAARFFALSIVGAQKTLYITNSYFVPDESMRDLLKGAVRRGVDVRVLTVSDKTDIKTTLYAGRALYEDLLEGGVRIYEYTPSMMHAKTFVVDGMWSTVGSLNFDNRSISFNNESNIVVLDAGFGQQMNEIFLEDLRYSKEIKLEEFRRRPWYRKVMEWGASRMWRIL
ncbi:phospholipase D-like domain-containing protein [soil metagenome]